MSGSEIYNEGAPQGEAAPPSKCMRTGEVCIDPATCAASPCLRSPGRVAPAESEALTLAEEARAECLGLSRVVAGAVDIGEDAVLFHVANVAITADVLRRAAEALSRPPLDAPTLEDIRRVTAIARSAAGLLRDEREAISRVVAVVSAIREAQRTQTEAGNG